MKSHTKYLVFDTEKRRDYINITGEVARIVAESGVREGLAPVKVKLVYPIITTKTNSK